MQVIWSIARNTLFETLRQNAYGVVLWISALLILLSPAFAMFTLIDSLKLVQDMGLATILLAGLFLGVLSSATVVSREIEGRTALTVLSKPVSREAFLLGKYLGLSLAVSLAVYILTILLLLTYRFGVKDAASQTLDWGVMIGIGIAFVSALLIGFFQNYFLGRPFITTAVWSQAATITVCLLYFMIFNKEYEIGAFGEGVNGQVALASLLILEAVLILVAIALAASTRGRVVAGLVVTSFFFLAGLLSEFFFANLSKLGPVAQKLGWIPYAVLPNLQTYWMAEAMVADKKIPLLYVEWATLYTVLYIGAVLVVAMLLFTRREVSE
ncbi:MAG: ABC transporter permease subunit [Planctomycetota bacterium]